MSLFSKMLQAVQSWRRPSGRKAAKRVAMRIDQLEDRKLLAVNFTGNVTTDFPATQQPGVVVLPDNPSVIHPVISPALQPIVKVSGFDISGIRVSYSAADDTLSFGIEQPASQQTGQPGPVIAGDADNNGNSATVNPAVTAIQPGFQDFADLGGSEYLGAFLDLTGNGYADVVAGFSPTDTRSPKQFQVAQAVVDTSQPPTTPGFGTELPGFEGNVYLLNSPSHPGFEFSITHFSQLYQLETGKTLSANSVINIGAFGGSADDTGIGEAFFPQQPVTLSQATVPPPELCSPFIMVNPHEHRVIDTRHRDLVRVYVFGTSGFDVTQIDPNTVSMNGAKPIAELVRRVNKDEFKDAVFVFRADQMSLPYGKTQATLKGSLYNGDSFQSSRTVLNVPNSAELRGELAKLAGSKSIPGAKVVLAKSLAGSNATPAVSSVNYTPQVTTAVQKRTAVVHQAAHRAGRPAVSPRIRHSMNAYAASSN